MEPLPHLSPGMPIPSGHIPQNNTQQIPYWLGNCKILPGNVLSLNYLWKGLTKPHHQLPFASFFIFSFLTLDETCWRTRRLVLRGQNKNQTEQTPRAGPLDQCRYCLPLISTGATASFRSWACWGFCFGVGDGHLPMGSSYF